MKFQHFFACIFFLTVLKSKHSIVKYVTKSNKILVVIGMAICRTNKEELNNGRS